jgi:hypothetical protein
MNQNLKASSGDVAFYEKIKTGAVRALLGKSDKGNGWRPVCRGHYLGSDCVSTEAEAIRRGKIFVAELRKRVEVVVPSKPKNQRVKKAKAVAK